MNKPEPTTAWWNSPELPDYYPQQPTPAEQPAAPAPAVTGTAADTPSPGRVYWSWWRYDLTQALRGNPGPLRNRFDCWMEDVGEFFNCHRATACALGVLLGSLLGHATVALVRYLLA